MKFDKVIVKNQKDSQCVFSHAFKFQHRRVSDYQKIIRRMLELFKLWLRTLWHKKKNFMTSEKKFKIIDRNVS